MLSEDVLTFQQQVEPRSSIPLLFITVITVIACLLRLIIIGSSTALNDVISLTVNSLYASYLMCCSLLLWRSCTGAISLPLSPRTLTSTTIPPQPPSKAVNDPQLTWGPWRIPGAFGIAVNAFACAYMVVIIFFNFWPPVTPTVASTMNYTSLVLGTVMMFSVIYYLVWADGCTEGQSWRLLLISEFGGARGEPVRGKAVRRECDECDHWVVSTRGTNRELWILPPRGRGGFVTVCRVKSPIQTSRNTLVSL